LHFSLVCIYNANEAAMATLNFSIDEALNILGANNMLPEALHDVKPDGDGLRVTMTGGIDISVKPESFAGGVLRLAIGSKSWAFKMADSLGKVDAMIDEAIRDFPFLRRENKTLVIDLDEALQTRVKGVRVKSFELSTGRVRIEF
jgi:hypothetical protein